MTVSKWRWALIVVVLSQPASAQSLRSVVVPADATVVIAPRGAPDAAPVPNAFLVLPLPSPIPPALPALTAGGGLAALAPALLPLAAAVLLGASAPGSGGTSSAPANTR